MITIPSNEQQGTEREMVEVQKGRTILKAVDALPIFAYCDGQAALGQIVWTKSAASTRYCVISTHVRTSSTAFNFRHSKNNVGETDISQPNAQCPSLSRRVLLVPHNRLIGWHGCGVVRLETFRMGTFERFSAARSLRFWVSGHCTKLWGIWVQSFIARIHAYYSTYSTTLRVDTYR